jgi:hypothetical protein
MLAHGLLDNGQVINGEFQPVDINQCTAGVQHTESFGHVPNQYLRVRYRGGTLHQGDATVPFDTHGYFEIALDRKTLTLSP